MPVQAAKDKFVQFRFYPSYYDSNKWQHLITDTERVTVDAVPATVITRSSILLDGGHSSTGLPDYTSYTEFMSLYNLVP